MVFATETLAAGFNMPARTTLLSSLARRRDGQLAALMHNELLQMAGRAGRRGFDTAGGFVLVQQVLVGTAVTRLQATGWLHALRAAPDAWAGVEAGVGCSRWVLLQFV